MANSKAIGGTTLDQAEVSFAHTFSAKGHGALLWAYVIFALISRNNALESALGVRHQQHLPLSIQGEQYIQYAEACGIGRARGASRGKNDFR